MPSPSDRILIVDDEPGMCRLLTTVLGTAGYQVTALQKPQDAASIIEGGKVDLVISDVRMPKLNGIGLLETVRRTRPDLPVILITAHGSVEAAVAAMKLGATDYVTKPFKNEEIKRAVANALEKGRLIAENQRLKKALATRAQPSQLVGQSPAMGRVLQMVVQLSASDVSVLIEGESGTGKELVARAIHASSPRSSNPFLAIHCGALPESLVESELFGFEKGAFTDALREKPGLFESADGGTVFLDEIGDMPPALQVKLLRFLQDHEVRRLGSSQSRRVDVRVLAATNKDLKKAIQEGRFREDLFYRLAVVPLVLPHLRARGEDIPVLAAHFLALGREKAGKPKLTFAHETLEALSRHSWPGNVRELQNAIEYTVALAVGDVIAPESLPPSVVSQLQLGAEEGLERLPHREAKQRVVETFERAYLVALLHRADNNITRAAQLADIDRKNLYDLLKKYGLHSSEAAPELAR